MSEERARPRPLGRGLSALLGDDARDYAALDEMRQSRTVPIEFLRPGRFQPRRNFAASEIAALVDSVKANGILQPILVRRHPSEPNAFEIVAGERRWRAAQGAQLHEVPVIVKELSDQHALEVALVENIQRQDLNPLEEAEGYRRLIEEFAHTQEALAAVIGKSRSHIANTLRLLGLPDAVKDLVDAGALSAGHARALIGVDNAAELALRIVQKGLSVRETERMVKRARTPATTRAGAAPAAAKDADTAALEKDLSDLLGLKVTIAFDGTGGALTIRYKTLEQLDDVLKRLTQTSGPPSH
ncbi:MAG: ParB/RepB/Spo0J family partition protein [Alphaproteobacteria bacterium]|nr:ParB/RepB/Spo0J family partition protein [Alphaproteobacteria bacterium]